MRRVFLLAVLLSLAACATSPQAKLPAKNFVVFFQEWSAKLDPAAISTIKTAAETAAREPSAPLTVIGYADPTGGKQANLFLSATRAEVVIDQLVADGTQRSRIRRHAAGVVGYQLTTQESRRVVIELGG